MSGSAEQVRAIPGERWYNAKIEGEIITRERRVRVARYRQKRGGKSHTQKGYVRVIRSAAVKPYAGRVRLRQPGGKVRSCSAWKLIAAAWICRIVKSDRVEYIDGDRDNIAANNLRVIRASGKRVTLPLNGGAV